jgi:energy-coupling factor transport system ATP-binding protein
MNTFDRKNIRSIRCLVGMVFQNPDNQIISPIVEEDVAFGPSNLGLSAAEIKERTDWALSVLGLEEFRRHSPHLLSGGQKQKVAIASVLAMQPSYLILDEPTSMLDYSSRCELISTLKYLNSSLGITVILISHYMEDMTEADRIIVLDKGKKYLDEPPCDLFSFPQKLTDIGITPPETVCMLNKLRTRGHKIDKKLITIEQVEDYICRLLK